MLDQKVPVLPGVLIELIDLTNAIGRDIEEIEKKIDAILPNHNLSPTLPAVMRESESIIEDFQNALARLTSLQERICALRGHLQEIV